MLEKYKKVFVKLFNWPKTKECKDIINTSLESIETIHKMRSVYCGKDGKNIYWACCDSKNSIDEKYLDIDENVNCDDCLKIMGWKINKKNS